jgi:predicted transcriptional regulator of viral defense system
MHGNFQPRLARLAARQHGNVTRRQLLELGLGNQAIDRRLRSGLLYRVHRGVYGVGRPPAAPLEQAAAAVLACGPGAALSHGSALALWGLSRRWPGRFEVTTPRDCRLKGLRVHLSKTLDRRDVVRRSGITVTSPARSLLDCAPRLDDRALARAVNDALLARHLRRQQLVDLLERCPRNTRGAARLRAVMSIAAGGPTRSEFEDGFTTFCARFGLPRPQVNTRVGRYEVDAYFEAERLIVELDGWRYHSSRDAFEADRLRDAEALARGIGTVRITWGRLTATPEAEAARLRKILEGRRAA